MPAEKCAGTRRSRRAYLHGAVHGRERSAWCACGDAAGGRASRTCVPGGSRRKFCRGGRGEQIGPRRGCSFTGGAFAACASNSHGVVSCALGWACWKTYGRPEADGLGSCDVDWERNGANHHVVDRTEAELAMLHASSPNTFSTRAILRAHMQLGRLEDCDAARTYTRG